MYHTYLNHCLLILWFLFKALAHLAHILGRVYRGLLKQLHAVPLHAKNHEMLLVASMPLCPIAFMTVTNQSDFVP